MRIGTAIERHDTDHQRSRVGILHSIPQHGGHIGIFTAAERSLGFSLDKNFGPFAMVSKDDLTLWIADPRT